MNLDITKCHNNYIKIPPNNGNIYVSLNVYFNNDLNNIVLSIDSKTLLKDQTFFVLLFDGSNWRRIKNNGIIDSSVFSFLSIKYDFQQSQYYTIKGKFYSDDNQSISTFEEQILLGQKKIASELFGQIVIPQLIYDSYPILKWDHSIDLDQETLSYDLQIYDYNENTLIYSKTDIPTSTDDIQVYDFKNINHNFLKDVNYRWRVRSKDTYGQYSDWSKWYAFRLLNYLIQNITVFKRKNSTLNQYVNIIPPTDDLNFRIAVQHTFFEQLYHYVYVYPNNNTELKFNLYIKTKSITISQFLYNCIYIKPQNVLNMNVYIAKHFTQNLYQQLYVTANNNNLIHFNCYIPILLKQRVFVKGFYQSKQFFQKINVIHASNPISFNVFVSNIISNTAEVLYHKCIVKALEYQPLLLQLYNEDDQQVQIDNRINVYNDLGNVYITCDQNGVPINVYPYVQGKLNNKINVYNKNKKLISKLFDKEGNQIQVYDSNNMIKNWLPIGTYYFTYTYYNNSVFYYYNFQQSITTDLTLKISKNKIIINPNNIGQWLFSIKATVNENNIHDYITSEKIYIRSNIDQLVPPFYINGYAADNNNQITNTIPIFSFNSIDNPYNSNIKYVLQISKDRYFSNIVTQELIQYQTGFISHQLPTNNCITDQGGFYFRIVTNNYASDNIQIIYQQYSNVYYFRYVASYIPLFQKVQRVNCSKQVIGFMLILRGGLNLINNIVIYKTFYSDAFNQSIIVYYQNIERQQQDLKQKVIVASIPDDLQLYNTIIITKNYSIIKQNIKLFYDYSHFPITEIYTDTETQQTVEKILLPVPKNHYLYFKCKVYHHNTINDQDQSQYTLTFNNLNLLRRYETDEKTDFKNNIVLMNWQTTEQLKYTCRLWNINHLPYQSDNLIGKIGISNFVISIRQLIGKITLFYQIPPSTIVSCNIKQRVWQTNYNAVFQFTVPYQPVLPISHYCYIIDRQPNTIPNLSTGQSSTGTLVFDLREVSQDTYTGKTYLHVRTVNNKNVLSTATTHYCLYYNNKVETPYPISVNGNYVDTDQCPVISYTTHLLFYWSLIIDKIDIIDKVTYDLQFSTDAYFNQIYLQINNIYSNSYTMKAKTLEPNKYYWRVRAYDQNEYSSWSLYATIYINKAPDAPTKLTVKNVT